LAVVAMSWESEGVSMESIVSYLLAY